MLSRNLEGIRPNSTAKEAGALILSLTKQKKLRENIWQWAFARIMLPVDAKLSFRSFELQTQFYRRRLRVNSIEITGITFLPKIVFARRLSRVLPEWKALFPNETKPFIGGEDIETHIKHYICLLLKRRGKQGKGAWLKPWKKLFKILDKKGTPTVNKSFPMPSTVRNMPNTKSRWH